MSELERIFSELVRTQTRIWNAVDARLRSDFDLPLSRYEPMRVMERLGPCRVNDIAAELVVTIGGTSKLVDRIERSGHCRRLPNPSDGRSSIIELTQSGRRLLDAGAVSVDHELTAQLGDVLSTTALQQFSQTLDTLRGSLVESTTS